MTCGVFPRLARRKVHVPRMTSPTDERSMVLIARHMTIADQGFLPLNVDAE